MVFIIWNHINGRALTPTGLVLFDMETDALIDSFIGSFACAV